MLNSNRVIDYVKTNLGAPFHTIELEDEKILDYIQQYTIREFSYYFPELRKMNLSVSESSVKVPGRRNEFYLNEPEGREILNVKEIYMTQGNLYALGHPVFGAYSFGYGAGFGKDMAIRNWALEVESSMMLKKFSRFDYTFQFTHPNIIRISPSPEDNGQLSMTIEYERIQSTDFSGVPNDIQQMFLELCLADIMLVIGRIRKKYGDGSLKTPFGDIPLSSDIYEEGKEKKSQLIEKFNGALIPNVRVNFG